MSRARVLERRVNTVSDDTRLAIVSRELRTLWRRVKIINWSIGMCTASALMVCVVVVSLFIGDFLAIHIETFVVITFVLGLLLLIVALVLFLKEVQLATRVLVAGLEYGD